MEDTQPVEDTPAAEGRQPKQASTADAAEAPAEPAQPPALPIIDGLPEMQEPLERPLKRVALPEHAAMVAELQVRSFESLLGLAGRQDCCGKVCCISSHLGCPRCKRELLGGPWSERPCQSMPQWWWNCRCVCSEAVLRYNGVAILITAFCELQLGV